MVKKSTKPAKKPYASLRIDDEVLLTWIESVRLDIQRERPESKVKTAEAVRKVLYEAKAARDATALRAGSHPS